MSEVCKWRTKNNGYKYVDSEFGSDEFGNGTLSYPYKTLQKGVDNGSTIICRGYFTGNLYGSQNKIIQGDYFGAAIWDGLCQYIMYGFTHNNMIIKRAKGGEEGDAPVENFSILFAGVGRAYYAGGVGVAGTALGVSGSSNLIEDSALYWNMLGGNNLCKYNIYSKIKVFGRYIPNPSSPPISGGNISFVSYNIIESNTYSNNTYYDILYKNDKDDVQRGRTMYHNYHTGSLFGKFCMFLDDNPQYLNIYTNCVFLSDCEWIMHYREGSINTDGTKVVLGNKAATKSHEYNSNSNTLTIHGCHDMAEATIYVWLNNISNYIKKSSNTNYPKYKNCTFSSLTSSEVFNNPEKSDFTLLYRSDNPAIRGDEYIGALPPAINVKILTNSEDSAIAWDETTGNEFIGIQSIEGIEGKIVLNENASASGGELYSKVIINDFGRDLSGVFAEYSTQISNLGIVLNLNETYDSIKTITLEQGTDKQLKIADGYFKVIGGDILRVNTHLDFISTTSIPENSIIFAKSDDITKNTSLTVRATDSGIKLLSITSPNYGNVLYIRQSNSAELVEIPIVGETYICVGSNDIIHGNRTIHPGHSFVYQENVTTTLNGSTLYRPFDGSEQWMAADMCGDFFVNTDGNNNLTMLNSLPITSGNYNTYENSAYSSVAAKTNRKRITGKYIQLKLHVLNLKDNE